MRANRMEVAARVNSEVITKRQFDRAYNNLVSMYRNMGKQGGALPRRRSSCVRRRSRN